MPEIEINSVYESVDEIPENVRGLFDEQDGKFVLTGVQGIKTEKDVQAVQEALRKERENHAAARNALKPWKDLDPEEVRQQLDRIKELEAAAEGKLDDSKIDQIVEGRITQKVAPLERQKAALEEELNNFKQQVSELQSQIERRDMNEQIRQIATEMNVISTAIPDIEIIAANYFERDENGNFITKADSQGVTPGVGIKQFLKEMQKLRPHWWPQSQGGGADGGGGNYGGSSNPWSAEGWNMTEQAKILREAGMEQAEKLAKAAGTTVGGLRPTK